MEMKAKNRVLIVDDERAILKVLSINLKISGYDVITAPGGEEALELVTSAKPDIMLLDILMLPLTGFDVLKKLREFSQIPVIAMTAKNDLGARALKEGANDFIAKPFLPEQLLIKIEDNLDCRKSEYDSPNV
jgi:DNA-binding response OmpR family regulator